MVNPSAVKRAISLSFRCTTWSVYLTMAAMSEDPKWPSSPTPMIRGLPRLATATCPGACLWTTAMPKVPSSSSMARLTASARSPSK